MTAESTRNSVQLPARPFLYTLDQIATLLDLNEKDLVARGHVYLEGRSTGYKTADQMQARNLSLPGIRPDWRIAEAEFLRWMRRKKFKIYTRDTVRF